MRLAWADWRHGHWAYRLRWTKGPLPSHAAVERSGISIAAIQFSRLFFNCNVTTALPRAEASARRPRGCTPCTVPASVQRLAESLATMGSWPAQIVQMPLEVAFFVATFSDMAEGADI